MSIEINVGQQRNLAVLILSFAFIGRIGDIDVVWYVPYLISLPLFLLYFHNYLYKIIGEEREISKVIQCTALFPYIVAVIYSLFLTVSGEGIVNSTLRSFSVIAKQAYLVFFAVCFLYYFREEAMEIIGNAMILSYFWTMVYALTKIGSKGYNEYLHTFTENMQTGYNMYFEQHDLGLSIGFVLIYELFYAERKSRLRIILLVAVMVLCWKRIALVGLGVVAIIWLVTKRLPLVFKNVVLRTIMIGILIGCFVYVMLISSGVLYLFAERFGVDITNRRFLFNFAQNLYEWKITFLGHGLGSVGKYMKSIVGTAAGAGAGGMRGVHNDILKTYIELGFVGSFLWFLWYIVWFPKTIVERVGDRVALSVYCFSMIYTYIVYATDNTSEYFIFQMVLYSLILYGCYREIEENTIF